MFTVIEVQDNHETSSVLSYAFNTLNEANYKYYDILRYAAISEVPIHSAILVQNGYPVKSDFIHHDQPENTDE